MGTRWSAFRGWLGAIELDSAAPSNQSRLAELVRLGFLAKDGETSCGGHRRYWRILDPAGLAELLEAATSTEQIHNVTCRRKSSRHVARADGLSTHVVVCLLRWNFAEAVRTDRELPLRGTRRPGGKQFFYELKAIRPGVHARQVEAN